MSVRNCDHSLLWVAIGLLVLHSCAVDDAVEKLQLHPMPDQPQVKVNIVEPNK